MTGIRVLLESSAWLIPVCILAGAAYAFFLYYHDRMLADLPRWLKRLLPVLRFLLVSLLAFLLLEPFVRHTRNEEKKPVIMIAHDNSSSVAAAADNYYRNEYPQALESFAEGLEDEFDVRRFTFSSTIEEGFNFDYSGKQTDLSAIFDAAANRFSNLNLGAVIIATDGNYNKGINPLYDRRLLKIPVFAVALGDTSPGRDLAVSRVYHNQVAYLGNTFPLEIVTDARGCDGCKSTLTVTKGNDILFSREIEFQGSDDRVVSSVQLKASAPGQQRYTVTISRAEGEVSTENNEYLVFVDVLDNRQKVLILAPAPHPDVNAIRTAIAGQEGFEAEVMLTRKWQGSLEAYSLLIAYAFDSRIPNAPAILNAAGEKGVPVWFIAGLPHQVANITPAQTGITAQVNSARPVDAFARIDEQFVLFTLNEELRRNLLNFPPLTVPFGNYAVTPGATMLMSQRVGNVNTGYPLWTFQETDGRKMATLAGEGIWRWKLQNFAETGNHQAFNELIRKTVQYLSVRSDRRRFRIIHPESFPETEQIVIEAELYNQSFELINEPDVSLTLRDEENKRYHYDFSRTSDSYRLDAGNLAPGIYSYTGRVNWQGETFSDSGQLAVLPVNIESQQIAADHSLLHELAREREGMVVTPAGLDQLAEALRNRNDLKPVLSSSLQMYPLVSFWWLLLLLILLVSLEWFIRRRFGAY